MKARISQENIDLFDYYSSTAASEREREKTMAVTEKGGESSEEDHRGTIDRIERHRGRGGEARDLFYHGFSVMNSWVHWFAFWPLEENTNVEDQNGFFGGHLQLMKTAQDHCWHGIADQERLALWLALVNIDVVGREMIDWSFDSLFSLSLPWTCNVVRRGREFFSLSPSLSSWSNHSQIKLIGAHFITKPLLLFTGNYLEYIITTYSINKAANAEDDHHHRASIGSNLPFLRSPRSKEVSLCLFNCKKNESIYFSRFSSLFDE